MRAADDTDVVCRFLFNSFPRARHCRRRLRPSLAYASLFCHCQHPGFRFAPPGALCRHSHSRA